MRSPPLPMMGGEQGIEARMTSFSEVPTAATVLDWDNPATWVGGVVPNASDADVTLTITPAIRTAFQNTVAILAGESFVVHTLGGPGRLSLAGTLAASGSVSADVALAGGTLNTDGLSGNLTGTGTVTVAGPLAVPNNSFPVGDPLFTVPIGTLMSSGGALAVTAASLSNLGLIEANGAPLTVTVTGGPGAFAQLSGDTLYPSRVNNSSTVGTYAAIGGGTLSLNVGSTIANDGAVIVLGAAGEGGGTTDLIQTFDAASGQYRPLQLTLQAVTGELDVLGSQSFYAANPLTVSGKVVFTSATGFSTPSLTLLPGSSFTGFGTLFGPVADNGTIVAVHLAVEGPVSGTGTIAINGGGGVADLFGAVSAGVSFSGDNGQLRLEQPGTFTGTVSIAYNNDQIVLAGIAATSVTGYSYAGDTAGGTLTIQEGAARQTLSFAGNLATSSFTLSSPANDPADLAITVLPLPAAPTVFLPNFPVGTAGLIANSPTFTVGGRVPAGASIAVTANGTPASSVTLAGGFYTAVVNPALSPGLQPVSVTATASNAAGSTSTAAAVNLDLLPAPINGVTTADLRSGELRALLNQGYADSFATGTRAIQLTNGTLSIALGTTEALVQELYIDLLNRFGDAAGLGNFASQIDHGTSASVVAQALIDSGEGQARGLGTESPATFVQQTFITLLGRGPSASDLAGFTSALANGATRGDVAAAVAASPEAQRDQGFFPYSYADVWGLDPQGALVTQLYQTALGRDPELSAVQSVEQQLTAGLSPQALSQIIASSAEFQADHNGQSLTDFVASLYQNGLGRGPSAPETQGWVSQIQGGATPAAVAYGIATSTEANGHLSPRI